MLTIKGEITKEDLTELLKETVAKVLLDELFGVDVGLEDFDIEDLVAEDTYERHTPNLSDFVLKFTVKKK